MHKGMQRQDEGRKAKLIFGLIGASFSYFEDAKAVLSGHFGAIDFESGYIDFDFTRYYEKELGRGLKRKFISFLDDIEIEKMPDIKKVSSAIELRLGRDEMVSGGISRNINIDPGYLNCGKLVLLSRKDNFHRIRIADGVYAEITLRFKDGSFVPMETTYPDYRSSEYIEIFNKIRHLYTESGRLECRSTAER